MVTGARELVLELPWKRPPLTANQANRGSNIVHARTTRNVRSTAAFWARSQRIGPQPPSDVLITWWVTDSRRRDSGALAPLLKATIDGLVDAGVWEDDCSRFVRTESCRVQRTDGLQRITLTIAPVDAAVPA